MATIEKPGFFSILTESSKITRPHSRHFLTLSFLFLLPLSFSIVAFPTLHNSITLTSQTRSTIFSLCYALFVLTFSLSSIATITYSLHNGFFGRPVNLALAIKSLLNSLPKLFATFLCAAVVVLGSAVGVGLGVFSIIRGIKELGFDVTYTSDSFKVLEWFGVNLLGLGLLWLCVNWALAPVVVVAESSWGLEPLSRSAHLVKGMRGVVVALLLYFGIFLYNCTWQSWGPTVGSGVWGDLWCVVMTVLSSFVLMLFCLQSAAANALLYMKCKAVHGEAAGETVDEYVSLPSDEPKVPRLVSIVQP